MLMMLGLWKSLNGTVAELMNDDDDDDDDDYDAVLKPGRKDLYDACLVGVSSCHGGRA